MDPSLQRIENVTANFFFWQGLRFAPLGLALLIGIVVSAQFADARAIRLLVLMSSVVAGVLLSSSAGRWYTRTYGRVRTAPERTFRRDRLKWNLVYPLMLASLLIDAWWKGPLFISGPVWAAAIVAYRNSTGGGRVHYLFIAGTLSATLFLPAILDPGKASLIFFFALLGGAYTIGGILDHLELRRIMPRPAED